MNKSSHLLTTLILAISSSAHASLFGPSNYEDCVLEGVKNAKSDAAVAAVYSMCGRKFPEKPSVKSNEIPGLCILYWDGIRTKRLNAEPKDWRGKLTRYSIARYDVEVAHVFVPKSYKETEGSQQQMYEQVSLFCR